MSWWAKNVVHGRDCEPEIPVEPRLHHVPLAPSIEGIWRIISYRKSTSGERNHKHIINIIGGNYCLWVSWGITSDGGWRIIVMWPFLAVACNSGTTRWSACLFHHQRWIEWELSDELPQHGIENIFVWSGSKRQQSMTDRMTRSDLCFRTNICDARLKFKINFQYAKDIGIETRKGKCGKVRSHRNRFSALIQRSQPAAASRSQVGDRDRNWIRRWNRSSIEMIYSAAHKWNRFEAGSGIDDDSTRRSINLNFKWNLRQAVHMALRISSCIEQKLEKVFKHVMEVPTIVDESKLLIVIIEHTRLPTLVVKTAKMFTRAERFQLAVKLVKRPKHFNRFEFYWSNFNCPTSFVSQ